MTINSMIPLLSENGFKIVGDYFPRENSIYITMNTSPDMAGTNIVKVCSNPPGYKEYSESIGNYHQTFLGVGPQDYSSFLAITIFGGFVRKYPHIAISFLEKISGPFKEHCLIYLSGSGIESNSGFDQDRAILLCSLDGKVLKTKIANFANTLCARGGLFHACDAVFNNTTLTSAVGIFPSDKPENNGISDAVPLPLELGSEFSTVSSELYDDDVAGLTKMPLKLFDELYSEIDAGKPKGWDRYNSPPLWLSKFEIENQAISAEDAWTNVCENCEAFGKIDLKTMRGEILGHEEGFSKFFLITKFPKGREVFEETTPGWPTLPSERHQLDSTEAKGYMPRSCKSMKAIGLCPIEGWCFSEKEKNHNPIKFAYGNRVSLKIIRDLIANEKRLEDQNEK